ncbi:cation:proton antiporter [Nocardioides sp.]|uniref:cation:proton antiporter n=1 Tax=Nocardioides sp. TaxID=35761 RepID=UPI0035671D55
MIELLVVAAAVLGYALVSQRLAMSPITAPMVFTAVGLAVGSAGTAWFDLPVQGEAVSILVEATLVLVLFTDAIRIDLRALRRQAALPLRLLGLGMPLTILVGAGVGAVLVPGLGLPEAALLAAVLAPTDAALGQAVVSDRRLPVRIRQTLNVESGLNDGIAVPVVTVLIALVAASEKAGAGDWLGLAGQQILVGLAVGVSAGYVGGRLLDLRAARGAVEGVYRQLAAVSIAVLAFSGAHLLGGNGFIAAFTAGLAFGHVARGHCAGVQDFTEDEGELLTAITFVIFGAVLAGPVLGDLSWQILLYALLSLTVVRMLPVLLALIGSGTLVETRLFLGWFGPRGLASILFALVVVEELDTPGGGTVFTVAAWTVLLSVFLHGMTASLWSGRLARRIEQHQPKAERADVPELPTRRRLQP